MCSPADKYEENNLTTILSDKLLDLATHFLFPVYFYSEEENNSAVSFVRINSVCKDCCYFHTIIPYVLFEILES